MNFLKSILSAAALALALSAAADAGDAANAYAAMKTLDGVWQGTVVTDFPQGGFDGKPIRIKLHLTSSGHAIVHEMREAGKPETAAYMGDVTVFYLEGESIKAVHFCDADTRSRLEAKAPADPKALVFDFVDVSGSTQMGYIHDIVFTMPTADHHIEIWTFVFANGKAMHATFDVTRAAP